jgi:hypothetical protein
MVPARTRSRTYRAGGALLDPRIGGQQYLVEKGWTSQVSVWVTLCRGHRASVTMPRQIRSGSCREVKELATAISGWEVSQPGRLTNE